MQGASPSDITENSGDLSPNEPTICPLCRMGYLIVRHCKSVCEQCGYVESCEDNFVPTNEKQEDEPARHEERTVPR